MTGELFVVASGDADESVFEEAHRVADLLGESGDRPSVVAVTFAGQGGDDALETVPPDEVVRLVPESGAFSPGAASTPGRVEAVAELAGERSPRAVLTRSSPDGDDLVARLAARMGGGCVTDCLVRVRDDRILAGRVVYEGRAYGEFAFEGATPVVSVNTEVLGSPDPGRDRDPTVVERTVSPGESGVEHVETLEIPEQDLSKARTIVSGGRGLGDPDGFGVIEELADALGGAVGASRPPADDGWVPYDRQIGVTGKEIDAGLYVACAISGDPYHMRSVTADHLLAINTDPGARIFNFTDLGVVGDVYEYAPAIAEAVRDAREEGETGTERIEADGGEP
jgi:electron transfer flavoprotein alpha subunit